MSPNLSRHAPLGHGNALSCTQHNQAETILRSLVKNGTVCLSQPLILLTLLLFGPNPISSVRYKDSEIRHFCSPGREERVAGAWAAAGAGGAGCALRAAAASKGNHSRETSPETKKSTFNFLTNAFFPKLFILAIAHSVNEIFNQLTSSPACVILS